MRPVRLRRAKDTVKIYGADLWCHPTCKNCLCESDRRLLRRNLWGSRNHLKRDVNKLAPKASGKVHHVEVSSLEGELKLQNVAAWLNPALKSQIWFFRRFRNPGKPFVPLTVATLESSSGMYLLRRERNANKSPISAFVIKHSKPSGITDFVEDCS